ncbi:DUF3237 domain-containing protein [Kineosporia sp. A_224]|uniref:DUF3237 domain-containing protein n=1 Tax=Kineosporia sp. A_224 TaxID=1962180 RepID=UPI000B4A74BD|nr:DUF3237 domain-containing protein [Kineosporia sp. A_224]
MTTTPPTLRHAFTIVAEVAPPEVLEHRGDATLEYIPITGGRVTGELSGTVLPGGGDWCLVRADGVFRVEARYLIRTDAGDLVDVHNVGYLRHVAGDTGDWTAMRYFQSTPVFRTASPDLQHLTSTVFVGRAHAGPGATTVEVFEVLA